ncbi:MAG: hypothetical protein OFPI_40770 [Osedax symbiont Rs2]|nr:MAG: hypothetical protein OFPI_40770 [Osedax symbiont Rs2]
MKTLIFIISSCACVYLLLVLLLYGYQRSFIYFPSPANSGNLPVESFFNQGEQIDVLVHNVGRDSAIIYFAGNAESVAASSPILAKEFAEHTLYAVNYRGYATSSGVPSENALNSDALHIYDSLAGRHLQITVIGRSLGSGVATYLAAQRKIQKMVLITPFDSVLNIARDKFPYFPIALLLKDSYDSVSRVEQIVAKTLVILAEHDQVIAASHSQRLIKAFTKGQVQVRVIAGSGHNDLSNTVEYYRLIKDFL